jgi:hypothetical protein
MNAYAKEKVFDELRKYHQDAFPEKLATARMDEMKTEFVETEDRIITMLLRLVNGKEGFVDSSRELNSFKDRVENLSSASPTEEKFQDLFNLKISRLLDILALAKESNFQLRKVRVPKAAAA